MGKRKKSSKKPQGPKKREPLPTTFQCLFCNHENAVSVKLDRRAGIGHLSCKVCGQTYQHSINYLSAAIDVYSEWVDACDAVAQEASTLADPAGKTAGSSYRDIDVSSRGAATRAGDVAREDDFIDDDEDAEGDFADE